MTARHARAARPNSVPRRSAWPTLLAVLGLRLWPGERYRWALHSGLIVLVGLLAYLNTLQNGFHLDDFYRVVGNPGVETLLPIWRHFGDPYTSATLPTLVQFRPLLPLTLSLNYALAGDSLVGYHLGNLLCQLASGLIVYALTRELLRYWSAQPLPDHRQGFLALCVALLFSVHPVSGILVNYISGRDLLLMQLLLSASLLCYLRLRRLGGTLSRWAVVLLLFELAMLAKTNAIVAPALVLTFELTAGREPLRSAAPYLRALPFALVVGAHLAYTAFYLRFSDLAQALDPSADARWTYPLTQAKLHLFHYLANFVWPFRIHQQPLVPPEHSLLDPGVVLGLAAIVGTLALAWRIRRTAPVLAFCILAYWIALAPESSVLPMLHNAVDYRPYPASPFLFLALALLLERYLTPDPANYVLLLLVCFFATASVSMNRTWRTEETLWSYSVAQGGDATAHLNLAMSLDNRQDPRVLANFQQALALDPTYALVHLDLGLLLIDLGRHNEGLAHCLTALQLRPTWGQGWYWLSHCYAGAGMTKQAATAGARAAALDTRNLNYQYNAAITAQQAGNYAGSLTYLDPITRANPSYKETLFARGFALWKLGQPLAAVADYRAFLVMYPTHIQARFDLGYTLMKLGRCPEAIVPFKTVLALQPSNAEARRDLVACRGR